VPLPTAKPLKISLPVTAPSGARGDRDAGSTGATPSYEGVLPALLQSRGVPGARDGSAQAGASSLLPNVQAVHTWPLSPTGRGATSALELEARQQLMAIETDDGSTVFMRADALAECIRRL